MKFKQSIKHRNMSTSTGHVWEHVNLHWPCMETCLPSLARHENMSIFTGHAWKHVHLHWPPEKFTSRVHLTQVRWWPSKKEIAANAVKDEGEEDYAWLVGMETCSDTMKTSVEVTQNNLKPNQLWASYASPQYPEKHLQSVFIAAWFIPGYRNKLCPTAEERIRKMRYFLHSGFLQENDCDWR